MRGEGRRGWTRQEATGGPTGTDMRSIGNAANVGANNPHDSDASSRPVLVALALSALLPRSLPL